ncbi:M56 family metallopeptidase [Gimesia chilikensis]|uniref:Protease HtpX n=1 Tax=Gimesia chilikensis TaxID=2605989 RepID=A0A517PPJ9_9PLAN|nr:M56 family metallopeptidase [Gimesia chilikensis]QDT21302.1 Protease HtpX [Gimesia chilikensis]
MHQLGISLFWLGLQVTLVSAAGLLIYSTTKQLGPRTRSFLLSCSIGMTLLLAMFALSPWPRWQTTGKQTTPAINDASDIQNTTVTEAPENELQTPILKQSQQETEWSTVWEGFLKGLQQKPVANQSASISTPAGIVGWMFVVGFLLAAIRLVFAFYSLNRLLRQATSLSGSVAEQTLDILVAQQQISCPLKISEHASLTTAAVIGWWRPVILLPTAWREWNSEQLRAVLAHELAHIRHRDYLAILGAELSRSLYFYHPLIHWLVARLRLEQELSADATAATISGGTTPYLVVLAEMAVSQTSHRLTGPARAFLPTHSTFLRRIEMLKQKRSPGNIVSRPQRILVFGVMLLIGLCASGFRGNQISLAQQPSAESDPQPAAGAVDRDKIVRGKHVPFAIDMVPNDALGVLALRPAELLSQQAMLMARLQLLKAARENSHLYPLDLPFSEIQSVTLILLAHEAGQPQSQPLNHVAVIQTTHDLKQVTKSFGGGGKIFSGVTDGGVHYLRSDIYPGYCLSIVNDHELIVSKTTKVLEQVITARSNRKSSRWIEPWKPVSQDSIAALFNLRQFRELVWKNQWKPEINDSVWKGSLAPVWEHTDLISLGVNLEHKFSLQSTLYQQQNGGEIRKTLEAAQVLGTNLLQQYLQQIVQNQNREQHTMVPLVESSLDLVKSLHFDQAGENVSLTASMTDMTVLNNTLSSFVPAMIEARKAALRMESFNNLKRLVLAMHLYHSKYKHFPPAVVIGPDGKTPHSWRVALLPFLDQEKLYKEYRLNEPWDSEHNKQVLAKMPAVFKNPVDNRPGHLTSYLAVTGPNTVFGKSTRPAGGAGIEMSTEPFATSGLAGGGGVESKAEPVAGVRMREITDGTSNTIAIVEARREIPWTKPEDIPFDENSVPELGGFYSGGFCVALCDGTARYLPDALKSETLKYLLLINDRHVIDWP